MSWQTINRQWKDFTRDALPGMLLELSDGQRVLVGDTNPMGGSCDCCAGIDWSDLVVRVLDLNAVIAAQAES